MNLQERLQVLIGHDVIVNMVGDPVDPEDNQPYAFIPNGRVRDAGADYLVIETLSEEDGGFVGIGAEWLLPVKYVTSIIHTIPDCAGCAIDTASGNLKVEGG